MTQIEKQAELLPCPMCGGDAKYGKFDVTPDSLKAVQEIYYHFACTSCGLATAECEYTTIEQAAAAWNTRAPTAREKELEALLQPFAQFGQALLAMEKIGDVGKLEDNNCVAAVSGGGGTFMLLWKHFNEIILYLYK